MNSKQKIQDPNTFENICKKLWKIVVKSGNIPPWKREELCWEHEQLTEKQLDFLKSCIDDILTEMLRELEDLKKAGIYSRWLEDWRAKYFSTNEIVAKLLDADELNRVHKRAQWLDEWKSKHDITVF